MPYSLASRRGLRRWTAAADEGEGDYGCCLLLCVVCVVDDDGVLGRARTTNFWREREMTDGMSSGNRRKICVRFVQFRTQSGYIIWREASSRRCE
jgi:hypothetical protein